MPTKTTSTNTAQFDPGSMSTFQNFNRMGSNVLQQNIADPMKQINFNQRIAQSNSNLFNLNQRNNSNVAQRASMFGNGMPGFAQNQLNQNNRWLSGQQNQNFNQNLFYADQLRQNSANSMLNYKPLQTGSTNVQQQSGLGTWLGPLVSAGVGAATMGMTGGMSGATSGAFGLGKQGGQMADNSWNAYQGSVGQNNNMISGMNTYQQPSNQWLSN